jgi:hypothetical protein
MNNNSSDVKDADGYYDDDFVGDDELDLSFLDEESDYGE